MSTTYVVHALDNGNIVKNFQFSFEAKSKPLVHAIGICNESNEGEKLEVHFRLSYPRNRRRTLRSRMHGSVSTCFAALRLRHKADPNYEARDSKRTKEVNYSMRGADYAYMTIHFL